MSNVEVVLCSPVRTAIGTYGGTLKDMPAPALGAAVIRESLKRAGLPADKVQSLGIRPRIPVVESAADFVETPVPSRRVFSGGADSCIHVNIAHC
ncbi:hypothetical protein [Paraburkholderia sp. A2WS-5]|uniref:thiolase family protein n=1 Tax=Paraburkholderia sp. A2WS-5 TaxID=3028372 RepID=UPI003BA2BE3F